MASGTLDHDFMSGFASHIQAGYFHAPPLRPAAGGHRWPGLEDPSGDTVARHAFTAEAQLFPVAWKRLHLGGAAGHVGSALVPRRGGRRVGRR